MIYSPADRSPTWSQVHGAYGVKWLLADADLPDRLRGLELKDVDWRPHSLNYFLDVCGGDGYLLACRINERVRRPTTGSRYIHLVETLRAMIERRWTPSYNRKCVESSKAAFAPGGRWRYSGPTKIVVDVLSK